MNTEYNYNNGTESTKPTGQMDNPRKGRIGAIVRLAVLAAAFILCTVLAVQDMVKGNFANVIGDIIGSFSIPCLFWLIAKGCCLATPLVRAIWNWTIPLSIAGFFIKIAICLAMFGLPMMLIVKYVFVPFTDLLTGENVFFELLLMGALIPVTVLVTWIDICKARGRSFLQTVKGLFSKKTS